MSKITGFGAHGHVHQKRISGNYCKRFAQSAGPKMEKADVKTVGFDFKKMERVWLKSG